MGITIDFETRSRIDLRKVGAWRYASDPTTDALCLCYSIHGGNDVRRWHSPVLVKAGLVEFLEPFELFDAIAAGETVEAHNAGFERAIWRRIMVARYGWPDIPDAQWRCSAAKAAAAALPRSLGEVAKVLRVAEKDYEGHRLMLELCKPLGGNRKNAGEFEESPEKFERLVQYCEQDVRTEIAVSRALPDLIPSEWGVWLADQAMNERGVAVDVPMAKKMVDLIETHRERLTERLQDITGGAVPKSTARTQLMAWMRAQGVAVGNTQAVTMREIMADEGQSPAGIVAWICLELNKASVSKYRALIARAEEDGRMRDLTMYHGAQTGRAAGKGFQPQNIVRGNIKEMEATVAGVLSREYDNIVAEDTDAMALFSAMIRGALVVPEGKALVAADYSAIETRVLFWLAGEEDALDTFRQGRDVYCEMGTSLYGRVITKKDAAERQLAKGVVLGCLGADTIVLTDGGEKKITEVQLDDRLWDGEEWVTHGGVVFRGDKETKWYNQVEMTPDHKVLTSAGEMQPVEAAHRESTRCPKWARFSANGPSFLSKRGHAAGWKAQSCAAGGAEGRISETSPMWLPREKARPYSAGTAGGKPDGKRTKSDITGNTRKRARTNSSEPVFSTDSAPAKTGATTLKAQTTQTTGAGASTCAPSGWTTEVPFCATRSAYPARTIRPSTWTVWTMTGGTNRGTSVLCPRLRTRKTREKSASFRSASASLNLASAPLRPTYDILNSGPRRRFAIVTADGYMVVSNCGYQMGPPKFLVTAMKGGNEFTPEFVRALVPEEKIEQYLKLIEKNTTWTIDATGLDDTPDNRLALCAAMFAVEKYRETYPRVKALWRNTENAAKAAMKTNTWVPVEGTGNRVHFKKIGMYLRMRLPSGRQLSYPFAALRNKTRVVEDFRTGKPKKITVEELRYTSDGPGGFRSNTRGEPNESTYSGRLVENLVQAAARDLMMDAMVRCEAEGLYLPVLTVHDELVTEADDMIADAGHLERLMCEAPKWASGMPLAAEGWIGKRYRK